MKVVYCILCFKLVLWPLRGSSSTETIVLFWAKVDVKEQLSPLSEFTLFISEWRCLQDEDGVENTLGTTNYPFTLFCTNNYFVLKAASSSCRVVDLKVPKMRKLRSKNIGFFQWEYNWHRFILSWKSNLSGSLNIRNRTGLEGYIHNNMRAKKVFCMRFLNRHICKLLYYEYFFCNALRFLGHVHTFSFSNERFRLPSKCKNSFNKCSRKPYFHWKWWHLKTALKVMT